MYTFIKFFDTKKEATEHAALKIKGKKKRKKKIKKGLTIPVPFNYPEGY